MPKLLIQEDSMLKLSDFNNVYEYKLYLDSLGYSTQLINQIVGYEESISDELDSNLNNDSTYNQEINSYSESIKEEDLTDNSNDDLENQPTDSFADNISENIDSDIDGNIEFEEDMQDFFENTPTEEFESLNFDESYNDIFESIPEQIQPRIDGQGDWGDIRTDKNGKFDHHHMGYDIPNEPGDPIYAVNDAIYTGNHVSSARNTNLTGINTTNIDGLNEQYLYTDSHPLMEPGTEIKQGDVIGTTQDITSTYDNTPNHTHYQKYKGINSEGHKNYIDPTNDIIVYNENKTTDSYEEGYE